MASIKVSQAHSLPLDQAKQRVDDMLKEYSSKFGLKTNWAGDKLNISGSGVEGAANVTGSSVDVELKLGLMASAFKGKIEEGLKEGLAKLKG
jgi:putative polyhydroxyalkanoate system protein